jgi:hypothetical protein
MTFNDETKGLLAISPTRLHEAKRHFSVRDHFLFFPLLLCGNKRKKGCLKIILVRILFKKAFIFLITDDRFFFAFFYVVIIYNYFPVPFEAM